MNSNSVWTLVDIGDLSQDSMKSIKVKDETILLIKKDKLYAMNNKCAHMECSLAAGTLVGYIVKCPCHDWQYDLKTGEFITAREIKLPIYEVKVLEGNIYIKL